MGAPQAAATLMLGPAGSDPFFSNVVFLWHADGANGATPNYTPTVGTVISGQGPGQGTLSTSTVKYGTASFASASDNIRSGTSAAYTIGTADYVFECWVYPTSLGAGTFSFVDFRPAVTQGWYPNLVRSGADLLLGMNSLVRITGTGVMVVNAWNYVALARASGNTRMYCGTTGTAPQVGATFVDSTSLIPVATGIYLCRSSFSGASLQAWVGNLDEVRFTIGTARGYTGASIPIPTAAFPDQ